MKKLIVGAALLAVFTSPVLARDYQRAGTPSYSMSGKMRATSTSAMSRANEERAYWNARAASDVDANVGRGPEYDQWLQYR